MADGRWVACRICGHPNKPQRHSYNACARCFHDATTGEFDVPQAFFGWVLLGGAYFCSALLGLVFALAALVISTEIMELGRARAARPVLVVIASLIGVGAALWLVDYQRRRGGFAGKPKVPLQMPPGASARRRTDDRVGHIVAGATLMVMSFGFSIESWFDLGDVAGLLAIGGLAALGACAGWIYNLYTRGRPRAG